MCGIIGLTGGSNLVPPVVAGLERLEYRGYDSCGIAAIDAADTLVARKGVGEVAMVSREERFLDLAGTTCLAHTRWATHGRVSHVNAHPHFDCTATLAVVHNGILENYEELRRQLVEAGHTFVSETDTEVVAHLLEENLAGGADFNTALLKTLRALKGTFGFGIISSRAPRFLYAARRQSPLILGIGRGVNGFASDPLAFDSLIRETVYLEDGEMAAVSPESVHIYSIETGAEIPRARESFTPARSRVDRGSFPDFMSKEISENAVATRAALSISQEKIADLANAIRSSDRTCLTGMGTAYYVALMGQYLFARWAGRHLPAISADELPYLMRCNSRDHVLAISQSGETFDTLKALRNVRSQGASISAILNSPTSTMARETDRFIDQQAGPEICVLSTKSTISQLTILARVALTVGEQDGALDAREVARRREDLQRLPALLDQVQNQTPDRLRNLARGLSVIRNWFFIGRAIYYGLAMEAALKFKEVTYSHAEGMPAGFLKHGTISLIDEAMHTAIFLPGSDEPELRTQTLGAAAEINARGGNIVAFQPEGSGAEGTLFSDVIEYPRASELTHPFLGLMQAQLFAYYTARALGRNVDKPRSLAKSVTVG